MTISKVQLLNQHRRKKRIAVIVTCAVLVVLSTLASLWLLPLGLIAVWVVHEAWLSDHLFYEPGQDHQYCLAGDWNRSLDFHASCISAGADLPNASTIILEFVIRTKWSGFFVDPYLVVGDERFDFERGAHGRRYVVLSRPELINWRSEVPMVPSHCNVCGPVFATGFLTPVTNMKRILIIAPHADDAELAAFGLYHKAQEVLIVTLTQGEIEAEHYQQLGLAPPEAAQLKGRLRSWDSIAVPQWGGVPANRCIQLGYFCMQLSNMKSHPDARYGSTQSGISDIREARRWNRLSLPGDRDGHPTWENMIADIIALLDHFQPEIIVTPHPERDPHPDHIAATSAVREAVTAAQHHPEAYFLYANHLRNTDRWPMGPAGGGVTLPPSFDTLFPERFCHIPLSRASQIDKAMALAMQHDLQPGISFKHRVRRRIQGALAGRAWPRTGDNEFFRKSVRTCELFSVRDTLN